MDGSVAGFVVAVNASLGKTRKRRSSECKMFGKLAEPVAPYMNKGRA